jgi:predicted PurR-regulated permease PerM
VSEAERHPPTEGRSETADGGDEERLAAAGVDAERPAGAGVDADRPSGSTDTSRPRRRPRAPHTPSPRWQPASKLVAGAAFTLTVLIALYLARNALTLVAMSGLLAFLVAPLIRLLQRRARFPKVLALLTSYLVVVIVAVLLGGLIVAGVATSFAEVDPAEAADSLRATAVDGLTAVRTMEVGGFALDLSDVVDPTIERLTSDDGDEVMPGFQAENGGGATTITVGGEQVDVLLGGLLSSAQVVGGVLTAMIVTFLIALYLSADSHKFHAGLLAQVPADHADDAAQVNDRIARVWRGYLYGQLINSLATGLLVWLVLWAVGLPGAFVLGLIMALLNMIPTFGPILAAVPGVLTAIALGSTRLDWTTVSFTLLVIAIYVVVVQVQANLMAPFITGQAVRMSPATILIGLIVGFQVGGLVGSLLVVPVLATFKEAGKYVLAKLLDRDPFPDAESPSTARAAS